jgi:hypothetical protein
MGKKKIEPADPNYPRYPDAAPVEYMGYGHGTSGTARVDVVDFGHGTTDPARQHIILFPAPGQGNIPLLGMWESPSPLPPGDTDPFGYPITLQPSYGVPLTVTQAELWDSAGAPVPIYPNPPECGTACYALIPTTPLQQATTYIAHVIGHDRRRALRYDLELHNQIVRQSAGSGRHRFERS